MTAILGRKRAMPRRLFVASLLLASTVARLAAGAQDATAADSAPRPNLLLITLDTTRADSIAPWGKGGVAPKLDALAAESVVAMNARAPAPITFPSHASMMTGLYPFAHGVRDNDLYQLDPSAQTAARLLQAAGFRTEAIVAATVLRAGTGLANGFHEYHDIPYGRQLNAIHNTQRPANAVTDLALERLAVADPRPWFFWLHYFDPHLPYAAPNGPPPTAPLREQYDAEIRFLDGEIGRVVAALEASGALERTWIVVVGDHGEGLRIQQELTHTYLAEEGTLRIPFFVRRPDGALRARLAAPVTAADVFPTLLAIAGLSSPYDIHGRDLLAMVETERRGGPDADALADRPIWFETWAGWHVYGWARLEGVIVGRFKYVRGLKDELFDVGDPNDAAIEAMNLAPQRPEIVRAMKHRFASLPLEPAQRFDSSAPNLPPEEVGRLMELGYLARSIGDESDRENGKLDPREHYSTALETEWALDAAYEGRFDEAVRVLEPLTRKYPTNALFREMLGKVQLTAGRKREAAEAFNAALAVDARRVASNFYLGALCREIGRLDDARRLLEKTVELSPLHLEGWLQLRAVHGAAKEYEAVLRDTIEVIRLAAAVGDADADSIAQGSLDEWLPNVLKRIAADPALQPRLAELVDRALAGLGDSKVPAVERAREILRAARPGS
jgi:arylsulfatase A-like enzyme